MRAFLNETEIDLFVSSLGADVKALTAADVQRRRVRTRKLRTKYRDLLQRQKLATRTFGALLSSTDEPGHPTRRAGDFLRVRRDHWICLLLVFVACAVAFTWAFDKVFGVPASAVARDA